MSTKYNGKKAGHCDLCNVDVKDIFQHNKTKKHLEALKNGKNTTEQPEGSTRNAIPKPDSTEDRIRIVTPSGIEAGTGDTEVTEDSYPSELDNIPDIKEEPDEKNDNQRTIAGIQIIGENTGKKEKGALDRLLDTAFSEQYAPITMSILNNFAVMLNQKFSQGTPEQQEGALVQLVGGGTIRVPNKEF